MPNLQKWVNLSFLICGIVAWAFLREAFLLLFDPLGWNRFDWAVAPSDVAGIVCGLILFIFLVRWKKANNYLTEVLVELSKVTWPNGKETVLSTGVVSVMVGIAALCTLFFDTVWGWVVDKLIYR